MEENYQLTVKDLECAYLAGILDGEGEIGIHKMTERKSTKGYRHRLEIAITNTCKHILEFVQLRYGGNLHVKQRYSEKHRVCYRWRVEGQTAIAFLKDIYPYLRIKRMQADIAFEFVKTLRTIGGDTRTPISDEVFNIRDAHHNRIKTINQTKEYVLSPGGDVPCP